MERNERVEWVEVAQCKRGPASLCSSEGLCATAKAFGRDPGIACRDPATTTSRENLERVVLGAYCSTKQTHQCTTEELCALAGTLGLEPCTDMTRVGHVCTPCTDMTRREVEEYVDSARCVGRPLDTCSMRGLCEVATTLQIDPSRYGSPDCTLMPREKVLAWLKSDECINKTLDQCSTKGLCTMATALGLEAFQCAMMMRAEREV